MHGVYLIVFVVACTVYYRFYGSKSSKERSLSRIERMLHRNGFTSCRMADEQVLVFNAKGDNIKYRIVYDKPLFILGVAFELPENEDLDMYQFCSISAVEHNLYVKACVQDNTDDNKDEGRRIIVFKIEAHYDRTKEIESAFPEFMKWLKRTVDKYLEAIDDMRKRLDSRSGRRSYIYDMEYYFLPSMIDAVTDGKLNPDALSDEEWLRHNIQEKCPPQYAREWEAFRIERKQNLGDYRLIVYAFPKPIEIPEAIYGAVLLNMKTRQSDFYTLEYSFEHRWVLGGMSGSKHANYGNIDSPDLNKFLDWVFDANKQLRYYTDCTRSREKVN